MTENDNNLLDSTIQLISDMDISDEAHKADKHNNIVKMKKLKKAINAYCDINDKVYLGIAGGIGVVVGIALMYGINVLFG